MARVCYALPTGIEPVAHGWSSGVRLYLPSRKLESSRQRVADARQQGKLFKSRRVQWPNYLMRVDLPGAFENLPVGSDGKTNC